MSTAASPAADFSLAILSEFVALGVTDAVLAPGSRSQALALTLAEMHRARMLDLQVRIDERVAGFTALGLGVETGSPAMVVTTSGTAVANLLPAVLEAHHSGVPMLLLTSDRPASMRGTAGNQTTWQPDLFGRFVRCAFDVPAPTGEAAEPERAASIARLAVDAALGTATGTPGPVHVNLQLREPLSGAVPDLVALLQADEWMPGGQGAVAVGAASASAAAEAAGEVARAAAAGEVARAAAAGEVAEVLGLRSESAQGFAPALVLGRGPRTVVIAGHGAGPRAEELAHEGGWPLIAEPSSGSRYGRTLIVAYRELLNDPEFGGRVERAIVFGHPTLSREVPALSLRDDVETIVVTPAVVGLGSTGEPLDVFNPGHRVRTFTATAQVEALRSEHGSGGPVGSEGAEREWLRSWVLANRALLEQQSAHEPIAAPNIELANSSDIAERRAYRLAETAALKAPITRRTLALAVWQATWPHDRLVLGASRLIRDLDRVVAGKKIPVHANRGLAGIDGTISTATGIALASQRDASGLWWSRASGTAAAAAAAAAAVAAAAGAAAPAAAHAAAHAAAPAAAPAAAHAAARGAVPSRTASRSQHGVTRVLLGDLTLLHDVGALLFGIGEVRPRIQVIVANDGGGTIFDTLEVASTADREAFDRVMLTPQAVDVEALAKAYGWAYSRASTRPELDRELTAPIAGPSILEVPLER